MESPVERISQSTALLMFATVLWLDFLQAVMGIIPLVGMVISPIIGGFIPAIFWAWFVILKAPPIADMRRLALMVISFFAEFIPIVNILPIWTVTIFITVLLVRHEDKKKMEEFCADMKTSRVKEKRYTIPTTNQHVVARKVANDNYRPRTLRKAA